MVSKNWLAGLVALAVAAVGVYHFLPSLGFGGPKSWTICASRNSIPTPGLTVTVTSVQVNSDGSHFVTFSDGTTVTYASSSEGWNFKVGDKVTNSQSC